MKVGDLVMHGERHGVIVEDRTMWATQPFLNEPYLFGPMYVLFGNKVERVIYADLRLVSESR